MPPLVYTLAVSLVVVSGGIIDLFQGLVFLIITGVPIYGDFLYRYITTRRWPLDPDQAERNSIYLTAIFAAAFSCLIFGSQIWQNAIWTVVSMSLLIYWAAIYLVNHYFDKASIHVSMICLWVVMLSDLFNPQLLLLLVALVPVTWSRLYLKKHTWAEVMWGLVIGVTVGLLSWGAFLSTAATT